MQDAANARIYDSQVQGALGLGNLDMQRQRFAAELPGRQVGDITKASLLQNVGDVSFGGPGKWGVTGGIRPSAIGGDARQAAQIMAAKQLEALQRGPQFEKIQMPTAPQQSKAGFMEKLLGGIGLGANLFGSVAPMLAGMGGPSDPGPSPTSFLDPNLGSKIRF